MGSSHSPQADHTPSHTEAPTPGPRTLDPAGEEVRHFGAHFRMSWWKPLVTVAVLPTSMILIQIVLFEIVRAIEGNQSPENTLTPLRMLAVNLSMGITGVLSVPFIAWLAKVPWRSVLSFPRRFDWRRMFFYLGSTLAAIAGANAALAVFAPEATTWTTFGITSTTVTLLLVVVLTIPLQSIAEELMFRGAIMPAVASWVRPVFPALVIGVLFSSPVFAAAHFAFDPWQFAYYTFLGVVFAVTAMISRGLEVPMALHIANNGLTSILNAVFAGGGAIVLDRSAVPGGPHLLIPIPFLLATVAMVWWHERRQRFGETSSRISLP